MKQCKTCCTLKKRRRFAAIVGQTICHYVPVVSDSSIFHFCVHGPPASMLFGKYYLRYYKHYDYSNLHHSHCLSVARILSCCSCPLIGNSLLPTPTCGATSSGMNLCDAHTPKLLLLRPIIPSSVVTPHTKNLPSARLK